jgi:hypothetical protein
MIKTLQIHSIIRETQIVMMLYVHYLHLKWDDAAGGGTQISATHLKETILIH